MPAVHDGSNAVSSAKKRIERGVSDLGAKSGEEGGEVRERKPDSEESGGSAAAGGSSKANKCKKVVDSERAKDRESSTERDPWADSLSEESQEKVIKDARTSSGVKRAGSKQKSTQTQRKHHKKARKSESLYNMGGPQRCSAR